MTITLNKKRTEGRLNIPPSKSCMQRALALSLLSDVPVRLHNPDYSKDSVAAMDVIQALGAEIRKTDTDIIVYPGGSLRSGFVSVGESGLGMRLFSPVAALFNREITLTGEGSLKNRPTEMLRSPLEQLGAKIQLKHGRLPVIVKGPLQGGYADVDGSTGSQLLTGLLCALPKAPNDSRLNVTNLKSKPYIDLTLKMLKHFGAEIEQQDYQEFFIEGNQHFRQNKYTVEADWSSASFHIAAAAVSGKLKLHGLNFESAQADRKMLEAVELFGAHISKGKVLAVEQAANNAFSFDATDCPDLFPPLAALASAADGPCRIKGVSRLAHKESNRGKTLQEEFARMGIRITLSDDRMTVYPAIPKGGEFHSHNDHRIAMAGAILSLRSRSPITISGAEAVNKSYPGFFEDFIKITS